MPAADLGQFHAWSDTIIGDWQRDSGEIMTALAGLYGYFGALIEIKRARPADDLISALIAARDQDDRLSEQELTVMCCTLLIGGHETTANQINLSLLLLFDHPGQVATLRADPELIPGSGRGTPALLPAGRPATGPRDHRRRADRRRGHPGG